MRASMLSLWVALAAVGVGSPAWAQAPAVKEPGTSAGPAKGDDALSPSTLPKARQSAKEAGTNRVDELSPDEARRLERIRAKAAGAKPQPAPSQSPQSEPVKEAAKPQPAEPAKSQHAEQPDRAAKAAASEPKAPAAPKQAARGPVADAKPTMADKASPRAPRQASRRVRRPSRETAGLERRARRWDYPPPRRSWPEVADRAPRVGDVVPYDAPLYPAPPGYGRGYPRFSDDGGYPPPPGYGRRWWP